MALAKRTQILMDPDEYERLTHIAEEQGVSVAELVRRALNTVYPLSRAAKRASVQALCARSGPVDDWEKMKDEIAAAREPYLS